MMTITTKTQYGILALLELAEHYQKELVQISDIVRRRSVPKNYIEQILNRLTKTGMVKSVRGNKGGYVLGVHPDNLTLIAIIEALEGEIRLDNGHLSAALTEVLEKIKNTVRDMLNISLSQLLERQKILDQQIMFAI